MNEIQISTHLLMRSTSQPLGCLVSGGHLANTCSSGKFDPGGTDSEG